MEKVPGGYQLDDAVRGLVTFRELNLMGATPRNLFADILRLIAGVRPPPDPSPA